MTVPPLHGQALAVALVQGGGVRAGAKSELDVAPTPATGEPSVAVETVLPRPPLGPATRFCKNQ